VQRRDKTLTRRRSPTIITGLARNGRNGKTRRLAVKNANPDFFRHNPLESPESPKNIFGNVWKSKKMTIETIGLFGQ
jgi:hypothetical protein